MFIFPKKLFFILGVKKTKISKIRDSHFINLNILHLFCFFCVVSLKTVPLVDSRLLLFVPKSRKVRSQTQPLLKKNLTKFISDEICLFLHTRCKIKPRGSRSLVAISCTVNPRRHSGVDATPHSGCLKYFLLTGRMSPFFYSLHTIFLTSPLKILRP